MSKFEQIREIQTQIRAAEAILDDALAAQTMLVAKLVKTRMELGLPAHFSSEAIAKCVDVAGHMSQARMDLVSAHDSLAQDAKNLRHYMKPGEVVAFDFYESFKLQSPGAELPAKTGEVVPLRAADVG